MLIRQYKVPIILSIIYASLCLLAFAFHMNEREMFSALFISILTLPWIILEGLIYSIVINPIFGIEFRSLAWDISYAIWTVVNTILIYWIYNRSKKKKRDGGRHA